MARTEGRKRPRPEIQAGGRADWITHKGETKRKAEWADEYGINVKTLTSRMARGMTFESAIAVTVKKKATTDEAAARRAAIYAIAEEQQPITVRAVYYQATVRKLVDKTEAGYKMVQTDLTVMRDNYEMPYDWLVDNTRTVIRPYAYDSVADALEETARNYRVNLWKDMDCVVQVWLEKDALSGVINQVTLDYGVPLMVARGYASLSYLSQQAEDLRNEDRPVFIYLLGDYDPSGMDAHRAIEETLRRLAPDADLTFERLGVTEAQIKRWKLPTRPTKDSDSRAAAWDGKASVELDAIDPRRLRQLVKDAINQHMTDDDREALRENEQADRNAIQKLGRAMADQ